MAWDKGAAIRWTPLTRAFAALFGTQLVGRALGICYIVVIGRLLGPEDLGYFAYGLATYLSLLLVGSFGQRLYLTTRLSRRPGKAGLIVAESFTIRVATTALAVVISLAVAVFLEPREIMVRLSLIFVLALAARSAAMWVREVHMGMEEVTWIPRFELVFRGAELVFGTILLLQGQGVVALCLLHAGIWTLEAVFALRRLHRQSGLALRIVHNRRLLLTAVTASLIYFISTIAVAFFPRLSMIVVGHAAPNAATIGQFTVALQILLACLLLPGVLGGALVPAINRIKRRSVAPELSEIGTLVKVLLVASTGFAAVIDAWGPYLVQLVFGARFVPAAETLRWLIWALGPYAVSLIVSQVAISMSGRLASATIGALMLGTQALLLAIFVPIDPLRGAMAAIIGGSLAGFVASMFVIGSRVGANDRLWWLKPVAMSVAAFVVMKFVPLPGPYVAGLTIAAIVLAIWRFDILTRHDRSVMIARVARAGHQSVTASPD